MWIHVLWIPRVFTALWKSMHGLFNFCNEWTFAMKSMYLTCNGIVADFSTHMRGERTGYHISIESHLSMKNTFIIRSMFLTDKLLFIIEESWDFVTSNNSILRGNDNILINSVWTSGMVENRDIPGAQAEHWEQVFCLLLACIST